MKQVELVLIALTKIVSLMQDNSLKNHELLSKLVFKNRPANCVFLNKTCIWNQIITKQISRFFFTFHSAESNQNKQVSLAIRELDADCEVLKPMCDSPMIEPGV